MFLLYWNVYVLVVVAVNFFNKELHWFCGKRIFIDGGIYMHLNEVADSNVASSLPI